MSEADFRQQANDYMGILVVYYPPDERGKRVILETQEVVRLGEFRIGPGRWTDGGSVPSIAHGMVNPLGYLFRAFLIHDTSLFDGWGWDKANERFNTAMRLLGAPEWQRVAIMTAVRGNAKWQHIRARMGWEADYVD